ncbi:MAG: TIGR02453 family protein [Alphaproteobacteria bacterium]|nr:TIGR02453 family protein [Alphaproteobacteria bacterium]
MAFQGFSKGFFKFFRDLKKNDDRDWFEANKDRYKTSVVAPMQDFIAAPAPLVEKTSPHFICDPRPNGGSMFRIYRDTRFSKDKTPYKTHASAHFRHDGGKDVHAPGYYLHLEPGRVMFGGGMWMPEPAALLQIRQAIANKPADWKKARDAASIKRAFGAISDEDKLTKAPRGFDPEHALIEDIKLKSFFVMQESNEADAGDAAFAKTVAKAYADAAPVMGFLCRAVGAKF